MTKERAKGDSLTIEMLGLRSARTKPQASVTCTKRTKTWRRILKRDRKRQPGTRVLDNGKRKETWYDVQVMDSEERHPEKRMRESKEEFHRLVYLVGFLQLAIYLNESLS